MPSDHRRLCVVCGASTTDRYCTKHAREAQRHGWQDDRTRGNAIERGYGHEWVKLRRSILMRDVVCQICKTDGFVVMATEVDHITPRAHGGTDDPYNLQALCRSCHRKKTIIERRK